MKLRAAVVGVGYLGQFHAQKYRDLAAKQFSEKIEFVGVCDLNKQQAEKVAAELKVKSFLAPRDLIGHIDMVSIATITPSHFELAELFLSHGIHVNVEKPMTVKLSEAIKLEALAKSKGLVLCVGHSERFNPVFQELLRRMDTPVYGEFFRHAPFKSRGSDVSVVHDLMIHDIDLALAMDDSEVKLSEIRGGALVTKTIDWASCCLEFQSGFKAFISISRMAAQMTRSFRVVDREKIFEGNLQNGEFLCTEVVSGEPPLKSTNLNVGKGDNLLLETEAFIHAVLAEKAAVITARHGVRAIRLVEEIVEKIGYKK